MGVRLGQVPTPEGFWVSNGGLDVDFSLPHHSVFRYGRRMEDGGAMLTALAPRFEDSM